ncbi:trace amine-associated receptor 9-like [Oculina patagonica]
MAEFTEDGNHTSTQAFFCSGLYRIHLNIFLLTLNILISITAFLGNVLIIVALPKVTSLHVSSRLLFLCLASTDLCVGLILQPVYIAYLMSSEDSYRCYYLDTISKVFAVIFCGVSLSTLTAISVDRLLALMLGLRYRQVVTLKRVRIIVILSWLFSSAAAMTYLYDDLITISVICIGLFLCIATSTVCYTKIFITLRHHQFQVQDHVHQGQLNEERTPLHIERYKKTVSSALWVQMTLVVCYLPFGIATIVAGVMYEIYPPTLALVWELTLSLLTFNSSLNPILYCWKIRGVRKAVKETITKWFYLSG